MGADFQTENEYRNGEGRDTGRPGTAVVYPFDDWFRSGCVNMGLSKEEPEETGQNFVDVAVAVRLLIILRLLYPNIPSKRRRYM